MTHNIVIKDWPTFRDGWFSLQVFIFNSKATVDILLFVAMVAVYDAHYDDYDASSRDFVFVANLYL